MIIWKDFKYLCVMLLVLYSPDHYPQIIGDYFVHKNTTIDSTSNVQTSEIISLKELLKLNPRFTNGSQSQIKKMDSLVTTAKPLYDANTKITFEYKDNEKLSTYFRYFFKNEKWNIYDKTMHFYDSNNLLTHRVMKMWNGGLWQNDFQETFEYDINGNEIFHLSQGWENSNWVNRDRTFSNYDSLNNFIGSISSTWIDSLWVFSSKSELNYNISKKIDEVKIYIFEGHWKKLYLTKYYYDENNELDSLIAKRWNGSGWSNPIKLYYDTLKNGQIVIENIDVWYYNQWYKSSRIVYQYDQDKYFLHAHCEYWQGDRWLPNIDVIHVRNPDGFEIHYITHQVDIYYEQPTSVKEENPLIVNEFVLEQNYPNPFNPSTTIKYNLPSNEKRETTNVKLIVYDVLGKEVITLVNKQQKPGEYEVQFDATEITSGIYFYKLKAGSFTEVKKMLLVK